MLLNKTGGRSLTETIIELTTRLLKRVESGDKEALEELLVRHRDWLRRIVDLRMDDKLRARVDPSDVVQNVQMEVYRRMEDYLERNPMPFRLWLRQTAYENILNLRRKHVDAECRSVEREIVLSAQTSIRLIQQLLGTEKEPDAQLIEKELVERAKEAMDQLSEEDREALVLRFFEGLENQEVTQLLGIGTSAASKRYGRALRRLRAQLRSGEDSHHE